MKKDLPLKERLMRLVTKDPSGCWLLTRNLTTSGYGRLKIGGRKNRRMVPAHRISYELFIGPIPEGLNIDHLCRVRNCVNPAHLEPVTQRENVLRGIAPAAHNARLTMCKKGLHPLAGDNLNNDTPGHRRCRACRVEYERARSKRRWADHLRERAA